MISPWKSDILQYFGGAVGDVDIAYVCQAGAAGLCDAIFRALPVIPQDEPVLIGLPDTIWFPADALGGAAGRPALASCCSRSSGRSCSTPSVLDDDGRVAEIQVKSPQARSNWIWGAFKMPGAHAARAAPRSGSSASGTDEFMGTLVNAWLARRRRRLGRARRRELRGRRHAATATARRCACWAARTHAAAAERSEA